MIVGLFMYKLTFSPMKGLSKIWRASVVTEIASTFQTLLWKLEQSNLVNEKKWESITLQQVFLALSALETPVDVRILTFSWIQAE